MWQRRIGILTLAVAVEVFIPAAVNGQESVYVPGSRHEKFSSTNKFGSVL